MEAAHGRHPLRLSTISGSGNNLDGKGSERHRRLLENSLAGGYGLYRLRENSCEKAYLVEGTGFSPYIQSSRIDRASAPEGTSALLE
jgi:hypothetical protein